MIVVDASLATKWLLWEADTRHARRISSSLRSRAIVRRANERKDIEDDALEALRKWITRWGEHVVKPYRITQNRLFQAGRLAIQLGHPLPDCIYLVLAMELSCELATCDARFRDRAIDIYPDIRLLD